MMCCLHCSAVLQCSPFASATPVRDVVYSRTPFANSSRGKFAVPVTTNRAKWLTCQGQMKLIVHASSKGFGQKSQPQQHKSDKRENTQPRADVSETQAPAPERPSRPPRNDSSDQEEVPEVVNDRMLKRIIAFCGIPVFTGFLLFPFFYYLKVTQRVDLPMSVVYIVQLLTFGGGFFGITYGILSASWDPRREGSLLGITEFKANLPLILDRVKSRGGKGRV